MDYKYQEIINIVKADIERVNAGLKLDINLNPKISKELENFIFAPSKRIRSLVTILYMRASKMYLLPEHYELLSAVELMHNVSLIHDDVIDESKIRRQRKTLNEKFDNQLAVISGDYLLSQVLKKLTKIDSVKLTGMFADTLSDMCKGEICQYLNRNKITSLDEYIEKSALKTASLFVSALKASVILAEGQYDEKTEEFITNFGLAFQIRDDLLNVTNKDKSGCQSDIDEGIFNAPLILSDDLSVGIEKTKDLLNNYINCAKQCLADLEDSPYKKGLYELLELIGNV